MKGRAVHSANGHDRLGRPRIGRRPRPRHGRAVSRADLEAMLHDEIDDVRGLADELILSLLLLDREDPTTVARVVDGQRERLARFEERVRAEVAEACAHGDAGHQHQDQGATRPRTDHDGERSDRRGGLAGRVELATAVAASVAAVLAILSMSTGTTPTELLSDDNPSNVDPAAAPYETATTPRDPVAPARGAATGRMARDTGLPAGDADTPRGVLGGLAAVPSELTFVLEPVGDLFRGLLDVARLDGIVARFLNDAPSTDSADVDALTSAGKSEALVPAESARHARDGTDDGHAAETSDEEADAAAQAPSPTPSGTAVEPASSEAPPSEPSPSERRASEAGPSDEDGFEIDMSDEIGSTHDDPSDDPSQESSSAPPESSPSGDGPRRDG